VYETAADSEDSQDGGFSSRGRSEPDWEVADELEEPLGQLNQQTPLWQSFLAAHRQIVEQLADEMLREHQLPLEWFDVLVHLADLPGMRARQKELRDRVLLSESGVSRLLARMEKALFSDRLTATDQAALSWVLSKLLARAKPDYGFPAPP
jgi:MarR family protein